MLEPGVNSYSTLAEADGYIAAHYPAGNAARQRWENLAPQDREILLMNACALIERLPLGGRKYRTDQPLAFPRVRFGSRLPPPEVPPEAAAAQAELALWLSDVESRADEERRAALRAQGVQSFSVGDLSESYVPGALPVSPALLCPAARLALLPWLNGGFEAC